MSANNDKLRDCLTTMTLAERARALVFVARNWGKMILSKATARRCLCCGATADIRGACRGCYNQMRHKVRCKGASWSDFVKLGQILPSNRKPRNAPTR